VISSKEWELLFVSKPCFGFKETKHPYAGHQTGGSLDVLDKHNGDIVFTVGDHEFDGDTVADYPQDTSVDYGKTFRINVNSKAAVVLSIGHRNHQGITVDSGSNIWTVEHGPQGGDELNLVEAGRNFGWPKVILGVDYGTKPWPMNKEQGRHNGYDDPVFAWVPSIAVSNIDQSIGFHPFWEKDLLVFTLKTMSIRRLRIKDNRVIFDEPIQFIERIRNGLNHESTGSIFLWTDKRNLYELKPAEDAWELLEQSAR
jgi:glucose/arabinose dehydrogenase